MVKSYPKYTSPPFMRNSFTVFNPRHFQCIFSRLQSWWAAIISSSFLNLRVTRPSKSRVVETDRWIFEVTTMFSSHHDFFTMLLLQVGAVFLIACSSIWSRVVSMNSVGADITHPQRLSSSSLFLRMSSYSLSLIVGGSSFIIAILSIETNLTLSTTFILCTLSCYWISRIQTY